MCKNPLFSFIATTLVTNPKGEFRWVFAKGGLVHKFYHYGEYAPFYSEYELAHKKQRSFIKNIDEYEKLKKKEPNYIFQTLPCGQCIECRLKYSRQWASRIVCETAFTKGNLFVTLTYDNENVPYGTKGFQTLNYDHFQKFMKDFRRYCDYHYDAKGIRYYAAGEYGEQRQRPHYHICLFNVPQEVLDDLQYYVNNFDGDALYRSPLFENQIWRKGMVVVGELNFKTAAYVGRYVMKKVKGPHSKEYYDELGILPERAFMSNRPGIGRAFFDEYKDEIYKNDELFLPNVGRVNPSAYFDKLYDFENPEHMEIIKARRRSVAESSLRYKLTESDYSYAELLRAEETNLLDKIKSLTRKI